MRSALICVFFTLVVQRDGSCFSRAEHDEEFNPTPIPLGDWPRDKQQVAGTLQEIIEAHNTAAVPAHYWENALRHSVYLTLVRDKIDQLIAQGDYLSLDSRPENQNSKEIDDHDLWDKIKTARFDRLKEEPIPPSDVTVLAKGRLIRDEKGYRFIEDAPRSNCSDSNCKKGVKAFWSVKRIRHGEASSGKYQYELTFSVTSETTKNVNKPYFNPVRTFTIKETTPPVDRMPARSHGKIIYRNNERPQRALWVHRNLLLPNYQKQPPPNTHGLDRIFSSLFADEDSYAEAHRYKPKTYISNVYSQQAAPADNRDPYHQKKLASYPIVKPQPFRSSHSPSTPPGSYVQNPYLNVESLGNHRHVMPYIDNRYLPSNVVKTTRPAVYPTPITNYPLLKESTIEVPVKTIFNATEYTTKEPDVLTTHNKRFQQNQPPMKISYLPDHIRPPVYNAPPGVFVTMDKKPFKPLPPLKYKPLRNSLSDFRPSPQVLDTQFSEQDMSADTAFRPITMNYTNADNINKNNNNNVRKPSTKKPAKKHENIKSTLAVVTPEIITAESVTVRDISDTEIDWANVLGAFTKTTPMASSKERVTKENINFITSTMPPETIIIEDSFQEVDDPDEDIIYNIESTSTSTTTTTTTTPKPKKRTRPPPKFNKTDKIKKYKRVTSTTTTTIKPTRTYPTMKPTDDLSPQASSAATSATNSLKETKMDKAPASTTTSTTTRRPTPTIKLTTSTSSTTTSTSSTTVDTEQPVVTTQPKSKNRFRQSTLMQKGTSVNHDKWSTSTLDKNRTNTVTPYNYPLRRKASKFQGYIPASTPRSPEVERDREDHKDHAYHVNKESISSSTTEKIEEDILVKKLSPTQPTFEDEDINDERSIDWSIADVLEQNQEKSENKVERRETLIEGQESKDDNEYIFPTASVIQEVRENVTPKDQLTTELTIVASPFSTKKNKTKCKKKKHTNLTTTEGAFNSSSTTPKVSATALTTESPVTHNDIFNELFGGFTMDDDLETTDGTINVSTTPPPEQSPSESEVHKNYSDDLEEFLHSINNKNNEAPEDDDDDSEQEYDDKTDDEDESLTFSENKEYMKDDYYEDSVENLDRPFSLLELMSME